MRSLETLESFRWDVLCQSFCAKIGRIAYQEAKSSSASRKGFKWEISGKNVGGRFSTDQNNMFGLICDEEMEGQSIEDIVGAMENRISKMDQKELSTAKKNVLEDIFHYTPGITRGAFTLVLKLHTAISKREADLSNEGSKTENINNVAQHQTLKIKDLMGK